MRINGCHPCPLARADRMAVPIWTTLEPLKVELGAIKCVVVLM